MLADVADFWLNALVISSELDGAVTVWSPVFFELVFAFTLGREVKSSEDFEFGNLDLGRNSIIMNLETAVTNVIVFSYLILAKNHNIGLGLLVVYWIKSIE